jgi:tripartite ATP-independent transporter DctP family solute receptor
MKKFGLMFLVMVVCTVSVFASGQSEAADAKSVVILVGTQDNLDSVTGKGLMAAQEELERISGGKMTLEIFPSSQLGDYKAMAGQVSSGELDVFISGYPDMSFMVPAFEVIGEPYVVTSYDHMIKVTESDFAGKLHGELEAKKIRFMNLWYTGARQTTANKPLNSIDDFKGIKLRTPNVPFLIHFAEAAGAIPSPIAFQEVYLALQTNQVEAQENPLTTINAMKFYEVQKYVAMTSHYIATKAAWINSDKWASLSAEQQKWLMTALNKGKDVNNEIAFDDENKLVDQFKTEGIQFTYPEIGPFQEAMKPYYKDLNVKYASYGDNIIASLQELGK